MTLPEAPAAITTMFPDDRSVQDDFSCRFSTFSSGDTSPFELSPWNQTSSPFSKSPWSTHHPVPSSSHTFSSSSIASPTELVASLVREEGHIYSLAASGNLLYTGSDSKNIRVWKDLHDFAAFKSTSGLVKAIVISSDRIFTGHQDGKIRIWKVSPKKPEVHKRAGTLPKLRDYLMMSLKPSNYVEVRRNRNALWIKHFDAVSCLALSEDNTLLYSGSWDKTFKVWRISDSKCLESVSAHDDAVNAVVSAFDSLVFSGSADGTVKVWCREVSGKTARHVAVKTLLSQDSAVTCLAVSHSASIVYCGSSDGMVNFWEKELKHGGILRGHKLAVLCLAAAGSLLVSGSADKSMCVWRREGAAHACLSILSGHEGPVKCLSIARESKKKKKKAEEEKEDEDGNWMVYSGSLDKSVKVWKVSEGLYEKMLDGHREAMNEKQQQQGSFSSPCIM